MSLIDSLPEDIIIDCISRLPRRYYPTLSLVSKYFRTLITSHELYARRLLLDRTENCLYVTISKSDSNDGDDRLYTLRQNFNSPDKKYSLVPVSSLPRLPPSASYVAVDSKIFVIPGESLSSTDTLLIDCRFHTVHHVTSMPNEVGSSVYKYSSVGEICIGGFKVGHEMRISDGVVMFLNQTPQTLVMCQWIYNSAKTWSSVYFKTSKVDDILNSKAWYDNDCFLDGVSYCYSPPLRMLTARDIKQRCTKSVKGVDLITGEDVKLSYCYSPPLRMLRARDIKQRCMKSVKGVDLMTGEDVKLSRTVIYGEKVVVFFQKEFSERNEIWCAEITVERDKEGELCGRVEWCGCVLEGQWPTLKNSLVVKV